MNKIDKRTIITIFMASLLVIVLLQVLRGKPITWIGFGYVVTLMAFVFAFGIFINPFLRLKIGKNQRELAGMMSIFFLFSLVGNVITLVSSYAIGKIHWYPFAFSIIIFLLLVLTRYTRQG